MDDILEDPTGTEQRQGPAEANGHQFTLAFRPSEMPKDKTSPMLNSDKAAAHKPPQSEPNELPTLPATRFNLVWKVLKWKCQPEKEQALQDHFDEDPSRIPPSMITGSGDPRVHGPAHYRDTIRGDFKCVERRLWVSRMRWERPGIESDDEISYDLYNCQWDSLIRDIARFPGEDIEICVSFIPTDELTEDELYERPFTPPKPVSELARIVDVEEWKAIQDGNAEQ